MPQPLTTCAKPPRRPRGPTSISAWRPGAAGFEIFETELGTDIAGPDAAGERIRVEGVVYDGTGAPVKDVLIEVWQANAAGHLPAPRRPARGRGRGRASAAGAG